LVGGPALRCKYCRIQSPAFGALECPECLMHACVDCVKRLKKAPRHF
jgi:hypothetical protein